MDDVLKQLNKLDSTKRNKILSILKKEEQSTEENGSQRKLKLKPKSAKQVHEKGTEVDASVADEVEILDFNEDKSKMGTYKRKRSMIS